MKADMEAMKEQITIMMEAMIGMRKMMEVNDGFPLRLLFVPLFLRTNIFKGNPVCQKVHRIVKY